jgi:hypothetical protein
MFKRYGIPLLAVALSSCALLEDAQDVILGEKGTLKVLLFAPPNLTATVTVTGSNLTETYRDDGRGYVANLELRPGTYTVTAQALEGWTAVVRLSEAGGNSSVSSPAEVKVSSKRTTSVDVSYAKNP